jgi:UDP-N-acetylglucosamine:LPS N-acetylglucosamine transferase
MMKVLAVSSSGGHWVQLLRLIKSLELENVVFVCTDASQKINIDKKYKFYTTIDFNNKNRIKAIYAMITTLYILIREKPDAVITTGAAPGFLFLLIAKKIFGSKTIWLDSIANVNNPSMAGLKVEKYADLWLTQSVIVMEKTKMKYFGEII